MAITGPYSVTWAPNSGRDDYLYRKWYRQNTTPRTKLSYEMVRAWTEVRSPDNGISDKCGGGPTDLGQQQRALNIAYERMVKSLDEKASLAVSLAERKQAVDMIASRASQLFSFCKAVKRLQFSKAAKVLGLSKVPPGVSRHKQFAANYLEFHFGWSPLVSDIGNAVEVLQRPWPVLQATGRGTASVNGEFSEFNLPRWQGSYYWYRDSATTKVKLHCYVRVSNPNLWLANQLGFVNPAAVAFELVPFSFVLAWFVNIEAFLSQFTDFVGLEILQPSTTYLTTTARESMYSNYGWLYRDRKVYMVRSSSLTNRRYR